MPISYWNEDFIQELELWVEPITFSWVKPVLRDGIHPKPSSLLPVREPNNEANSSGSIQKNLLMEFVDQLEKYKGFWPDKPIPYFYARVIRQFGYEPTCKILLKKISHGELAKVFHIPHDVTFILDPFKKLFNSKPLN